MRTIFGYASPIFQGVILLAELHCTNSTTGCHIIQYKNNTYQLGVALLQKLQYRLIRKDDNINTIAH